MGLSTEVDPILFTLGLFERIDLERGRRWGRHETLYSAEFRRQMVDLVRVGRSPEDLAQEFEPTGQSIRNWVKQADLEDGRRTDGLTIAEKEELTRLRKENRQLREEREILRKAAVFFATETGQTR